MDLGELTIDDFSDRIGEPFVIAEPAAIELTLATARQVGERPPGRDPFSLVFRGPPGPVLPQSIYRLEHAELGALEIFIVPVGQDAEGTRYEAIFT